MPQAVASSPAQPASSQAPMAKNAFAHMMQQQRERSQSWTFFLGGRQDGAFFWHIWRDDRAPDTGGWSMQRAKSVSFMPLCSLTFCHCMHL